MSGKSLILEQLNRISVSKTQRKFHKVKFRIQPLYNKYRLDRYLKIMMPWYSKNKLNTYISNGEFTKNGRVVKKGDKLNADDVLIRAYYKEERIIDINKIDIEIIYEDDELLVVSKPPTIAVHPNSAYQSGTMLQILEEKYGYKNLRLTHRLDKETSGLILIARNKEMATFLTKKFYKRNIEKRYLAFVNGEVTEKYFSVKFNMGDDINSKIRLKQWERDDGAHSHTEFTLIKQYKDYALVEALLKTGRQHQIRVHLSYYGNYVIGDKIYGVDEMIFDEFSGKGLTYKMLQKLEIDHHLLHAYKISFYDERRDKFFSFKAKLPDDYSKFIKNKL